MGYKILAVDDNKDMIAILSLLLNKEGYQVITAMDGLEAIQRAEQEQPALILLDVMIPKKDGFEVCRAIKENARTKEIPVIFITAKIDLATHRQGLALGGCEYLTKPLNPREILQTVKKHLPSEPPLSSGVPAISVVQGVAAFLSACIAAVQHFLLISPNDLETYT